MVHFTFETNSASVLIWPNANGIGIMNPAAFKQTAAIALKYKVIKKAASPAASYDHQLAKAALQYLQNHVKGIDVTGKNYQKATVAVTAGGK